MENNKQKGIQDLVATKLIDRDTATIHYLDYSLIDDGSLNLGLSVFTKFIQLETNRVTSKINLEQKDDIAAMHGLDTTVMLNNTIQNEMEQSIDKEIYKLMESLGEKLAAKDRTKFQKWANKWFGYEPRILIGSIKDPKITRKLIAKILNYSNKIATTCRRGPANFIICGPQIGAILQDSSSFIFGQVTTNIRYMSNSSIYHIGMLVNLDVYIDQNMEWSDKKIIVGRKTTTLDQPGIILLKQEGVFTTIVDHLRRIEETMLEQRISVSEIGSAETMFYTLKLTEKPHNLFKHLIKKYLK